MKEKLNTKELDHKPPKSKGTLGRCLGSRAGHTIISRKLKLQHKPSSERGQSLAAKDNKACGRLQEEENHSISQPQAGNPHY